MLKFLMDIPKYCRRIVNDGDKFRQCDRVKIHKNDYTALINDHILLGRIDTAEAFLKQHKENPYMTVDELIGDLQIVLMESHNKLNNSPYTPKIKIENLIEATHGQH